MCNKTTCRWHFQVIRKVFDVQCVLKCLAAPCHHAWVVGKVVHWTEWWRGASVGIFLDFDEADPPSSPISFFSS